MTEAAACIDVGYVNPFNLFNEDLACRTVRVKMRNKRMTEFFDKKCRRPHLLAGSDR